MTFENIQQHVTSALESTPIVDIHTHIYSAAFGDLLLWGIDELLTYHYLFAESCRYRPDIPYDKLWNMNKTEAAELVWDEIFVKRSPISEAARGVVTTLQKLGIDPSEKKLATLRKAYAQYTPQQYIDKVFELANVDHVIMTNDPFDKLETPVWNGGSIGDSRFKSALRLDGLLNDYDKNIGAIREQGFEVTEELNEASKTAVRDFLHAWIKKMNPCYMAVSLPPTFQMNDGSKRAELIRECIIPVASEYELPFATMIGVKKLTNPALRKAGDSVGKADISVVEGLARDYPKMRFLVTMLSRENQHELCVAARKFSNLLIFGCWWFTNNPSIIREITAERFEMLGLTFIPQHSDARVLDQLIYKWSHSRELIGEVLTEKYWDIARGGWPVTADEIKADIRRVLGGELLPQPTAMR